MSAVYLDGLTQGTLDDPLALRLGFPGETLAGLIARGVASYNRSECDALELRLWITEVDEAKEIMEKSYPSVPYWITYPARQVRP